MVFTQCAACGIYSKERLFAIGCNNSTTVYQGRGLMG